MLQGEECGVVQCGRAISAEEIAQIRETAATFGSLSRWELALTISEHLQWRTASGGNKADACMKLLEKLEGQGVLKLPLKRGGRSKAGGAGPCITDRTRPEPEISGGLSRIGPVRLRVVEDREETGLWNEFVARYHYLGYKRPFGCHLRYFIETERSKLGCLLFAGAAKSIGMRDRWIGWGERERLQNLGWVVSNTRFVIFPWVRVRYLASHVLGGAARRLRDDWRRRWGCRPIVLETFVDPLYFEGTCYRAANWVHLGMTTGAGLARKGRSYTTSPKKLFVLPLVKDFRALLCSSTPEAGR